MSAADSTVANRHGNWALALGVAGLLTLMAPAVAVVVIIGAAISVTALVLGINGVLAVSAGRASNRPQAVTGIVLGAVGSLLWLLAVIGMVLDVTGA